MTDASDSPDDRPLLIGSDSPDVRTLAAALDADLIVLPAEGDAADAAGWGWAGELERWRTAQLDGDTRRKVVVAVWASQLVAGRADDLDLDAWATRAELPLARWAAALGVAVGRVADDGAVVAVSEGPTALECAGWAPETAVAEGVRALSRSLALAEGSRGVRVNTVNTPARFPFGELVHPAPPMSTFPGEIDREVAGAVRLLLSPDAVGLTGGIVHADAGRAWR